MEEEGKQKETRKMDLKKEEMVDGKEEVAKDEEDKEQEKKMILKKEEVIDGKEVAKDEEDRRTGGSTADGVR